jgi:vacuolar-type H+-ATPase subunit H
MSKEGRREVALVVPGIDVGYRTIHACERATTVAEQAKLVSRALAQFRDINLWGGVRKLTSKGVYKVYASNPEYAAALQAQLDQCQGTIIDCRRVNHQHRIEFANHLLSTVHGWLKDHQASWKARPKECKLENIKEAESKLAAMVAWLEENATGACTDATAQAERSPKKKRSTTKGSARVRIIAALTDHHKYARESAMNQEPIQVNALARKLKMSRSTVSEFLKNEFGGYAGYMRACRDVKTLISSLKLLNGEFSPRLLVNQDPADSIDPDADE